MGRESHFTEYHLYLLNFEPLEYIIYWEKKKKIEFKGTDILLFLYIQKNNLFGASFQTTVVGLPQDLVEDGGVMHAGHEGNGGKWGDTTGT